MNDPMFFSHHKLGTGLQVFFQHRELPWFHARLIIHAGFCNDPLGKEQLAHFLEHRLFGGTEGLPRMNLMEYERWVTAQGFMGIDNASTHLCHTMVGGKTSNDRAARFFRHIAAFTQKPILNEGDDHDRAIVIREGIKRQSPRKRRQLRAFADSIIGDHPVARAMPYADDAVVNGLTNDDARALHRSHYASPNMALVIAGGLDEDLTLRTLEDAFAPTPTGYRSPTPVTPPHFGIPKERERFDRKEAGDVATVDVGYTWAFHQPTGDSALSMMTRSWLRTLLNERIREKARAAYSVGVSYTDQKLMQNITISVTAAPDKVTEVRRLIDETMNDVRDGAPLQSLAENSYACIALEIALSDMKVSRVTKRAVDDIVKSGVITTNTDTKNQLLSVTPEQVSEYARTVLAAERCYVELVEE